jgi:hypothetical protein
MTISISVARALVIAWFGAVAAALYLVGVTLLLPNELTEHLGYERVFWLGVGFILALAVFLLPLLVVGALAGTGTPRPLFLASPVSSYGFLLYALALTVATSLISLVCLVALGPRVDTGERFEELVFFWLNCHLLFAASSILSYPVYKTYCATRAWYGTTAIFLGNMIAVVLIGIGATWAWIHL